MDNEKLIHANDVKEKIEKLKAEISVIDWVRHTHVGMEIVAAKENWVTIDDYTKAIILPIVKWQKEELLKVLQDEFESL